MSKLRVFVGSSLEASDEDKLVRRILEDNGIEPITWKNVFNVGEFSLDSLINISEKVHGAIIISTPDDKVWYRGTEIFAPRDNILFEMGLFIKALGAKHVALIFCKDFDGKSPKMPTDINGMNVIFFEKNKSVANETHLEKWIYQFKQFSHPLYFHLVDAISILKDNFHKIPDSWIDEIKNYILNPFEEMSKAALLGDFVLNTNQYYDSVLSKLGTASISSTIRAISLVSPDVWTNNPHQKRFYEYNVAAKKRGATIRRLFVASDELIFDHWTIIQQQIRDGFEIKTVHPRIFSEYTKLDDSISFEDSTDIRYYKTIQFYDNPFKLKGARLILNNITCRDHINSFDEVWKVAKIPSNPKFQVKKSLQPPGLTMKVFDLPHEVVTCKEAASARKIPLVNELKTLILQTPSGFIAAHLPADGELSLRAVKKELEIKNIKIAEPEQIATIGLQAGTVSAVLNPVWDLPHFISRRLLSLKFVMTNNGTKTGYFKFDPLILLDATQRIVGNFERPEKETE